MRVGLALVLSACWTGPSSHADPKPAAKPPKDAVTDVVAVAVGSYVTGHAGCALRRDGTVVCWGGPNLLHNWGYARTLPVPDPFVVPNLHDATAVIASGNGHCAVKKNHTAVCWAGEHDPKPIGIDHVAQLVAGSEHLCALLDDHTVQCSGHNGNGELGAGAYDYNAHPWQPVPGATDVIQLAAGHGMCALQRSGTLLCWGPHPFRAEAKTREEFIAASKPQPVAGLAGVQRVALGNVSCIMRADAIDCTRAADDKPYKLERIAVAAKDVVQLATGADDACFLLRDGRVQCWGPGERPSLVESGAWSRQLEAGYKRVRTIGDLYDAVQISIGGSHSCAVTASGRARCWGINEYGELDDGTLARHATPSWVVWFKPELMPGPGETVFGCHPTPDVQRACMKRGRECRLLASSDAWAWGTGGGALCDQACIDRQMAELKKRAMPPCECNCPFDAPAGPPGPPPPPPPP